MSKQNAFLPTPPEKLRNIWVKSPNKPLWGKMEFWHQTWKYYSEISLRGNCTTDQKLACVVPYLKIINTFLKNYMHLTVSCPRNSIGSRVNWFLDLAACVCRLPWLADIFPPLFLQVIRIHNANFQRGRISLIRNLFFFLYLCILWAFIMCIISRNGAIKFYLTWL